jgi:endonuclease/exonuclease/phosphatase family metal-dependent hydrolase
MRIDYILHSEDFTPYNFEVQPSQLSDHYPLTVYLGK